MTEQDPNATPGASGPGGDDESLDETRTDWPPVAPPDSTSGGDAPAIPAAPGAGAEGAAPPPPGQPVQPAPPAGSAPPPAPAPFVPPPVTGYDALGQPYASPGGAYPQPGMTWAPPPDVLQAQAGLQFAEVGPRFVAWLIDSILVAFVGGLISIPIFLAMTSGYDWGRLFESASRGGMVTFDGELLAASLVTSVVSTAISFVYFVFLWSSGGRATLGMRLLKLQIGKADDGRTLGLDDGTKRWFAMGSWLGLLSVVPILGSLAGLGQLVWYIVLLVTTGSSPSRQGLHDRFARTAIVQTGPAGSAWVIGCLVIVMAFALLFVAAIVGLIFLGSQVSDILERSRQ